MDRPIETIISEARFGEIRDRFQTLREMLTDAQLLSLADTYHEILRLRRVRRASQARLAETPALVAP